MKKLSLVFTLLIATVSLSFAQQKVPPMRLTSSAFPDGTIIPLKYTQAAPGGTAVSPEFIWNTIPPGTQSFVFWMHDTDVSIKRSTEDNLHWLAWNIPGQATALPENVPAGAHLPDGTYQTSYSGPGYKGPGAGASGPLHHYVFELYALDIKLDEQAASTPIETRTNIFKLMQGHILGKAAYVGLFKRPQ